MHRALGPGLLESSYEACLAYELMAQGLKVEVQKPLALVYKSVRLDCGYRIDLLVEDEIIVELKSVESILPIHRAQVLSYPRLSGHKDGLLINFHVKLLKEGIERMADGSLD